MEDFSYMSDNEFVKEFKEMVESDQYELIGRTDSGPVGIDEDGVYHVYYIDNGMWETAGYSSSGIWNLSDYSNL
jgi:hypothetical protein